LGPINDAGIAPVVEALRAHPPTLNILIDSGGGYVSSGWQLIGEIEEAQAAGTIVICSVDRLAASMAAVIFESCDLRLMRKGAALLFHTASASNVSGNQWDFERMARELDAINARIAIYVTGRLTISQTDYERNVSDRDWWLGTEGALEIGAIDEALPPLRR
jgi:ATP-dependent protease ClpP protease subunit